MVKFFKLIQEHEMFAMVRIGPFVQAEWNHGFVRLVYFTSHRVSSSIFCNNKISLRLIEDFRLPEGCLTGSGRSPTSSSARTMSLSRYTINRTIKPHKIISCSHIEY